MAVIIAEEITVLFFNVNSLFNEFIPIIAIQMTANSVGSDSVTLVFTKVLARTVPGTSAGAMVAPGRKHHGHKESEALAAVGRP